MLVKEDSKDLQDLFDCFNFLLKIMVCTGISGFQEDYKSKLKDKLKIFIHTDT